MRGDPPLLPPTWPKPKALIASLRAVDDRGHRGCGDGLRTGRGELFPRPADGDRQSGGRRCTCALAGDLWTRSIVTRSVHIGHRMIRGESGYVERLTPNGCTATFMIRDLPAAQRSAGRSAEFLHLLLRLLHDPLRISRLTSPHRACSSTHCAAPRPARLAAPRATLQHRACDSTYCAAPCRAALPPRLAPPRRASRHRAPPRRAAPHRAALRAAAPRPAPTRATARGPQLHAHAIPPPTPRQPRRPRPRPTPPPAAPNRTPSGRAPPCARRSGRGRPGCQVREAGDAGAGVGGPG